VSTLCTVLAVAYFLILLAPAGRDFFELAVPGPAILAIAAAGSAFALGGLWLTDDRFVPGRATEPDR
jgi:cation-transporting P-type ATPase E